MSIPKELIYITLFISGCLLIVVNLKSKEFYEYNCSDFMYQEDAQKVFEENPKDIYKLDRDKNNIACQNLPTNK